MADFEGMAKALQIPANILNNLDKVDEKINKIATDSEKMANAFQSAIKRMGDGSDTLLQRLTEIQRVLNTIGGSNVSSLGKVSTEMKSTATEAEKAASSVSKVTTAVNSFGASGKNLAELKEAISSINKQLYNEEGVRPASAQQRLVNVKKAYQEELKIQETSDQERIKKEQEADTRAYNNWLKIKDQELREEQRIENEKRKIRERNIQEYIKQLEKQARAQAKLDSSMRRSNYANYVTTPEGALRTAERATNYNQRAQAIKNLEGAMKRLNSTSENYQKELARLSLAHRNLVAEQRRVEDGFRRIRESQSHLMDTSAQLQRQLALIFSLSAIEGYVMKLIQVRGEFELQNTALASILGNKEQADQLFGQITQLAVQSPFTIKELTTYTKSLAAYSVEYENLYGTLKQLADVSSGLGVDMQRLILAFGQVKAANYLRGTETRQITEAGINML